MAVRVRSADGDCFELSVAAASLSPVIAGLLEDDPGEIPTPSLRTAALQRVVHHCEWFVKQKCWNHRLLGATVEDLEPLYWASNYLGLEALQFMCLIKLAMVLRQETAPKASSRVLRHILEHSRCLPPENTSTVIGLLSASDAGEDARAAIASYSEHPSEAVRLAVVCSLSQHVQRGDSHARSRLLALASDKSEKVRSASLHGLQKVAPQGDLEVLRLAMSKTRDAESSMKCAALGVLGGVARRGDALAISVVSCCLSDVSSEVRCSAVNALCRLGERGSKEVLEVLVKRFEDVEKAVRHEAVLAVAQVAEEGDNFALDLVCQRLEHRFWWVTKVALDALVAIAKNGSEQAIDAVVPKLRSESANTRRVAADAMQRLLQAGGTRDYAIEKVAACLEDPMEGVRETAMNLLAKVGVDSDVAVTAICSRFESDYEDVRQAASAALASIRQQGDPHCVRQVLLRCEARQPWVRVHALEALIKCCGHNDPQIIKPLCRRLVDSDEYVRRAAQKTFSEVFATGAETSQVAAQALETAVQLLEDQDPDARQRALRSVRAVAFGNSFAVGQVCQRLQHVNSGVRKVALEALPAILTAELHRRRPIEPETRTQALKASMQVLLQDPVDSVRLAALHAVACLVDDAREADQQEAGEALLRCRASGTLRRRCLELLERVAPRSLHGRAVLATAQHLEDQDPQIRRTAAEVLARFGLVEPALVLEEISSRVTHRSWRVRWAAVRALAWAKAAGVDPEAQLSQHLAHPHARVRDVASFSLSCFNSGGDLEHVLEAVAHAEIGEDATQFDVKRRRLD